MNTLSSPLLPPPPLQELQLATPFLQHPLVGSETPYSRFLPAILATPPRLLCQVPFLSLPPGSELLRASAPAHFSSRSSCTWTPTSLSISCVLTMSIFISLALGFFELPNSYPAAYLAYLHVFLSSGHLELNRSKLSYWFSSLKLHLAQFSPNE